jgi:hypothetical protein
VIHQHHGGPGAGEATEIEGHREDLLAAREDDVSRW